MSINGTVINGEPINGAGEPALQILGQGSLISIEQTVALIGSGSLISIEQDLQLRLSSVISESFISIEQSIEALGSGSLISIEQLVTNTANDDHLNRTGWDAELVIDGRKIPRGQIHGMINIERTESNASLMSVTLIPAIGVQDIEGYHGKSITLDVRTASGTFRAYTGVIDIPEVDLIEEKITLRCTDKRTELINNQLTTAKNVIGFYSSKIFPKPKDVAEEVEQRLTTTPYALDFDAYGNFSYTPWLPKSTADFTLADADVYRDRPRVSYASRGRVVNKVNLKFDYRYSRHYNHERFFTWTSPIAGNICLILEQSYSVTSKDMVRGAATSAGWPIRNNDVSFTELWGSGWYRCNGVTQGFSTIQLQGSTTASTDADGNTISDSNGNTVYETNLTGGVDYSGIFCMGASWYAGTRWAQTITETYATTVQAPQSQSQYGDIEISLQYGIQDDVNDSQWEAYSEYDNSQGTGNFYVDKDVERDKFNTAFETALNVANTTILGSHRDTRVIFDSFIRPDIDLKHTIDVSTDEIVATGKVFRLSHSLNVGTGEARTNTEIALYRASGSTSASALVAPTQPTDNVSYPTTSIELGNHFGEDPSTAAAASWTGMVGNKLITGTGVVPYRSQYSEQFIVDVPAVPDNLRNAKVLNGSGSYNVEIPNNTLTITFDGVS